MKNRTLQFIVSLICIVLIALSIYCNPDAIRIKTYEELTADDEPIFTGIIEIWQISTWRVGQSSKTLVLMDAAAEFEKKHKMLYIEIEIISYEDYIRKTSQGIYPDVLSFPAEMEIDFSLCQPISVSQTLCPIHQKAFEASNHKAVSWLAASNVVQINAKQADKKKCSTEKYQSASMIAESIDKLSTKESYVYGSPAALIPLAISEAQLEAAPLPMSEYSSWLAFARKETPIIYGCVWQTHAMDRLLSKDKGFQSEYIYPSDNTFFWTQNFCIFSTDTDKNQITFEYFDLVLSDNWQIKIADQTASFSVKSIDYNYTGVRGQIIKNQKTQIAIIPGLGISDDEIIKALSGDIQSKTLIKEKLVFH